MTLALRHGRRTALLASIALLAACAHAPAPTPPLNERIRAAEEVASHERSDHMEAEGRLRAAEARNQALVEIIRGLGGNVQSLTGERRELEAERTTLQGSLGETRQALDELRAREARMRAQTALFHTMVDRFRAMIDAGQLRVQVTRNRMVVELPESVLFETGHAELRPTGQLVLQQIGRVLVSMARDFQVAGHTDNVPIHTPRFDSNWELSTARATTVARHLIELGMEPRRISAAGYADAQPIGSNDTPEGRRQNRRIEIVLVPDYEELPDLSAIRDAGAPAVR